jgi:hypothetical protein
MQQTDKIERLRSSIREEKGIILKLDETIADAGLKATLNLASNWLGDVENFFLNTKTLQEPSTERALADWLSQAERVVQNAVQQRKFVEDIVKKYGPNARTIPT